MRSMAMRVDRRPLVVSIRYRRVESGRAAVQRICEMRELIELGEARRIKAAGTGLAKTLKQGGGQRQQPRMTT